MKNLPNNLEVITKQEMFDYLIDLLGIQETLCRIWSTLTINECKYCFVRLLDELKKENEVK